VLTLTIKLKLISIVTLKQQGALITVGTHIVKNIVIVYSFCYQVSF